MSLLIPAGLMDAPRGKIALTSIATGGSNSIAAAGTNLVQVPFYFTAIASTAASFTLSNGTGGSILAQGILTAGVQEWNYWANAGDMAANKGLVLETGAGIGKGEFHVYFVVTRGGSPQTPLNQ